MPSIFSKFRKDKDGSSASIKSKKAGQQTGFGEPLPQKPVWSDAWSRKFVEPEEVQELLRVCTLEMKSRALDLPFMLLPFRPNSDSNGAKTFIRSYFGPDSTRGIQLRGQNLQQELKLTEPDVLCSVLKWCWGRLPGGVVTWEAYELFKIGEQDSDMAKDSFETFMPISVDSEARREIIEDFFDLLASIAARGKRNGLGGRKLSRLAGWWAFEHKDTGNGFDGGYKSWASAADAASHLFFAYLRSKSPGGGSGVTGISTLPMSLQSLVQATEYPPETPSLLQSSTSKIVMVVDSVSPTPFALLRRAKHFEYRDDDPSLQMFASYQDPVNALTEECRRVLESLSKINESASTITKPLKHQQDESWSRFEDLGFSGMIDETNQDDDGRSTRRRPGPDGLSSKPQSRTQDMGRPTTPSWADFLSSGFADEPGNTGPAPLLLPPDKVLPPIDTDRVRSSQSHRHMDEENNLLPGELASIAKLDLDDSFWWVWITSLAGEESAERKAVFGRCALIETSIQGARWLVIEEKVRGAAPAIEEGAYVVEKKSRFGLSKKSRLTRRKSTGKKLAVPSRNEPYQNVSSMPSKTSIGPDQHARIQAAAAALQQRQRQQDTDATSTKRSRLGEGASTKTNSVMTLQPLILSEASPAMKWANKYDKDAIREAYLGSTILGKGASSEALTNSSTAAEPKANGKAPAALNERDLPAPPPHSEELSPVENFEKPKIVEPAAQPPADPHPALEKKRTPEKSKSPSPPLSPVARKPIPSSSTAASKPVDSSPQRTDLEKEADAAALLSQSSSPSKSVKGKKLKKKSGGGGFKNLFSKKKTDKPPEAVAALQSFDSGLSAQQQQPTTLARRLSKLGKNDKASESEKSSLVVSPEPERVPSNTPSLVRHDSPARSPARSPALSPHPRHIPIEYPQQPPASLPEPSPSSLAEPTRSQKSAAPAFTQGPLEDPSALFPETRSSTEPPTPIQGQANGSLIKGSDPEETHEELLQPEPKELSPEEKAAIEREATQQQQDRWAQIRKAAADRAAARGSDDNSRPSQTSRTEDGETSGEETIESRVARIKARVAELTGNMENQAPVKPEVNRAWYVFGSLPSRSFTLTLIQNDVKFVFSSEHLLFDVCTLK
ncbi:MAG: hypothetical protein M1814_003377 [Vezdaea aestivalis]|nr:MAG: hypothetical protein M1814_003377 [Vezdaea aestivalis]